MGRAGTNMELRWDGDGEFLTVPKGFDQTKFPLNRHGIFDIDGKGCYISFTIKR